MKISKVVNAMELENATRNGWALVFTGTQSDAVYIGQRPATPDERNNGQYGNVTQSELGTRLAFVVEKDNDALSREEQLAANLRVDTDP